jgi:hypothetical protein
VTERTASLGGIDLALGAVALVGVCAVWLVQLAVVPAFAAMFADFGGPLPDLTKAVIAPYAAVASSALTVGLATAGLVLRAVRGGALGRAALVGAALVPVATVPLEIVALYWPIYALAGEIR